MTSAQVFRKVVTMRRALLIEAAATLCAVIVVGACGAAVPSDTDHPITLTLIRHGQSAGNASGVIDTSVPGPVLTDLGRAQALMAANRFSSNDYDGVFASSMVRTQETAQPMATALGERVEVLPGLREVEAGQLEGQPEATAGQTIYGTLTDWVAGDRGERIPGSIDGNEFDARFDEAVQTIYDSGDTRPVAFSHGGAIAAWTLMNVDNTDASLLTTNPLPNTAYVVVSGSPTDGWKLMDWNGITARS